MTASTNSARLSGRHRLGVAIVAVAALAVAATGAAATLGAITLNGTPQRADAGTLSLTMANNGAGFGTAVTALAPGDVVQRYVDLTNGGTLAAQALTMSVATSVSNPLTVDGTTTRALRVSVNSCSGTWTPANGTCSGTTTALVPATAIGGLSTAVTLIPGGVPVGSVTRLQVVLTLPDQDEVTTNGVAPSTTIQGQSAALTFTFAERQRAATQTSA